MDLNLERSGKFKHLVHPFSKSQLEIIREDVKYLIAYRVWEIIKMVKEKMVKEKIIPVRGIIEDWSKDKGDVILEKHKTYARKNIKNQLLGNPDFEEYAGFLVKKESSEI